MVQVMISAGELSGDEHGARLLEDIRQIYPDGRFFGMGGRNLRAGAMEICVDIERTGTVMGFTEILGGLKGIRSSWKTMTALLAERRPDLLLIINYSEFNLRLARFAKKLGIKVLFYIPPQVWAWRPGRVKEIDRVCDLVATIFPFEKAFYATRGCHKVCSVGHPFVTQFENHRISSQEREQIRVRLGIDSSRPLVLLFPGSRRKEILAHLDFVLQSFRELKAKQDNVQGLLVSANDKWISQFTSQIPADLPITVTSGDSLKLLQAGDIGLIKSGTSNLQATFAGLPFVMFYRPSRVSAFIIRRLVKGISQYSIVNILRPGTVPEVVGEILSPVTAADELSKLVGDTQPRRDMMQRFREVIDSLSQSDPLELFQGCTTASQRTARLVQGLIDGKKIFS